MWQHNTRRINGGCKAPKAIINLETEPIIAAGGILSGKLYGKIIPIVDKPETNPMEVIEKGDLVKVNANAGLIEIIKTEKNFMKS